MRGLRVKFRNMVNLFLERCGLNDVGALTRQVSVLHRRRASRIRRVPSERIGSSLGSGSTDRLLVLSKIALPERTCHLEAMLVGFD